MATNRLDEKIKINSDINEHIGYLYELSKECDHITEMGTRAVVSTWAFVNGVKDGGTFIAIDIKHPSFYGGVISEIEDLAKERNVNFKFIEADTLNIKIDNTDLLFLDTLHTYEQVKKELNLHAQNVNKYIVFHDTVSCPEIVPAIDEIVEAGGWRVFNHRSNNNGVTTLIRC